LILLCLKNGLSYTTFFHIQKKENIIFINSTPTSQFSHWSMHGWRDENIKNVCKLDTFCSSIDFLKNHSHVIIQALNTYYLWQHYQDNNDHNLQVSHIPCILETKIQSSNVIQKVINTSKFFYISIYGGHGLIMMYNMQIS
jgi:hypothetical protein